ncbi:DUF7093 family protein [Halobaculum sp. P14]|uniref:DUF7093 family protein n=1 Tax=Halobaculum sp. P14 TaxID=3421638 RepID=UPI003EB9CE7D
MGLRCLLGHNFTEPQTEREREERGDEVIITITEVKECKRCGETRVVSENKEVTAVEDLIDGPADPASDRPAESTTAESTSAESTSQSVDAEPATGGDTPSPSASSRPTGTGVGGDAAGDDAEFIDADAGAGTPDDGSPRPVEGSAGDDSAAAGDEDAEAAADREDSVITDAESGDEFDHPEVDDEADVDTDVDDDAEILDGESGAADAAAGGDPDAGAAPGERQHGEWPDADANRKQAAAEESESGPRAWPDADATHPAEAAEETDQPSAGESADVEFLDDGSDDEDDAATEARSGVVSGADHPADGAEGVDGEDAEFIDADDDSAAWPQQRGEDEGFDAEVSDGKPDEGVSVDGNLTPQVDSDVVDDEDAEFIEAGPSDDAATGAGATEPASSQPASGPSGSSGAGSGTQPSDSGPADAPSDPGAAGGATDRTDTDPVRNGASASSSASSATSGPPNVELSTTAGEPDVEYVCPECGKTEPVGASSMRAGDICPDCKRGYIQEREL